MSYKLIQSTPKPSFKRFVQRSLGLDLIKGLGITLKEFFTPSTIATIKYPLEKIPLSPRYRAIHKLMRLLESGEERCIGCGLCEKICISNCIKIETGYGEDGRKKIESYTINFGRCIYCGFCAEVCPEIAIIHGERYENVSEQRAHFANKGAMLTPLDLALRGNIDEFAGFGSLSANADECVKMTPTDYIESNSPLSVGNSSLGASCGDFENLGRFADSSPVSHPKFPKNSTTSTANTRICDSNKSESQNLVKNAESSLDSANQKNSSLRADSQNLRGNPPIKKSQNLQNGLPRSHSLARNDEILDSSLRKCYAQNDKNSVRVAESNAESSLDSANQNNSSLRADSQNLRGNPPIEKIQDLQGGLPREQSSLAMTKNNNFAESARNDEILDSSLRKCSAQNDNAGLDSADSQNLGENNAKNAESNAIKDTKC